MGKFTNPSGHSEVCSVVYSDCCAAIRHRLRAIRSRGNPRRLNPGHGGLLAA